MTPIDCTKAFAGALALAMCIAAGPVAAQEADTASDDQIAQENQVAEMRPPIVLICKQIAVTGTRIPREYCLTQDDWDAIREDSVRALQRLRREPVDI